MSAADVGLSRRGLPLKPPALAKPVGLTEPVLEVSVWDPYDTPFWAGAWM
jgi:hypothetical protein